MILPDVTSFLLAETHMQNCSCYGAVNLLEHGMKVEERVLEERLYRMESVDEMPFGFMPERGPIYAVSILRRM